MDDARVRIVRSARRKRSAAARVVDGVVEVRVPVGLSAREEARIVERLVAVSYTHLTLPTSDLV